jgi:hypothetical protein
LLKCAIPRTWDLEISYADELDEMWTDELWDLGNLLDDQRKWWILKPGMADRGMGIRLFNSKAALHRIFEEFEGDSDDEETQANESAIVLSQLRYFVIQVRGCEMNPIHVKYLPSGISIDSTSVGRSSDSA